MRTSQRAGEVIKDNFRQVEAGTSSFCMNITSQSQLEQVRANTSNMTVKITSELRIEIPGE